MSQSTAKHVIFGTGPVGLAIMDALLARGETSIRMVNRSGRGEFPEGVMLSSGDAMDSTFTREVANGAEALYFAIQPPYDKWPELFPPMQSAVLEGAIQANVKRFVAMENLYGYGKTGGTPMTEETPLNADYAKGIARANMSRQLIAAHEQGQIEVATGRASDFFGPRVLESMMGERVIPNVLVGKPAQLLGNLDLPHTQTYMPDIGKALVILGERDEAAGQAWHIPSPKTLTQREFVTLLFEEAGHPPKIQSVPKLALRALGLFNSMMREVLYTYYQFEEPFIMDSSKFEKTFGMQATPLEQAIPATIQWYRDCYESKSAE